MSTVFHSREANCRFCDNGEPCSLQDATDFYAAASKQTADVIACLGYYPDDDTQAEMFRVYLRSIATRHMRERWNNHNELAPSGSVARRNQEWISSIPSLNERINARGRYCDPYKAK